MRPATIIGMTVVPQEPSAKSSVRLPASNAANESGWIVAGALLPNKTDGRIGPTLLAEKASVHVGDVDSCVGHLCIEGRTSVHGPEPGCCVRSSCSPGTTDP